MKKRFLLLLPIFLLTTSCGHAPSSSDLARTQTKKSSRVHIAKRTKSVSMPKSKPLIVIDPGHGDHDGGAQYHNSDEKQLNLITAQYVKKHLNSKGYRVLLTRNRDVFVPLIDRAILANRSKCEAFVSIHYNSAKSIKASGVEVYFYHKAQKERLEDSKHLASKVLDHIVHHTGAKKRGVKFANFCVIRETAMPAILVEGGFMTHPKESKLLKDSEYLDKLAKGIAEGVDKYFQTIR
ncbi:MAG: N-acetylmuramoyl-L-alanine amidase [Rhabdochlamydiaceae bacterium]|nr:N-acetylmuramoyl-L-alanine amidase [Candidatus Amphrikana amoebophyrae]